MSKGFWYRFSQKEQERHLSSDIWNLTNAIPGLNITLLKLGLKSTITGSPEHLELCADILADLVHVSRCKKDKFSVNFDFEFPSIDLLIKPDPLELSIKLNLLLKCHIMSTDDLVFRDDIYVAWYCSDSENQEFQEVLYQILKLLTLESGMTLRRLAFHWYSIKHFEEYQDDQLMETGLFDPEIETYFENPVQTPQVWTGSNYPNYPELVSSSESENSESNSFLDAPPLYSRIVDI
jgi:hypothetical protein